MFILRKVRTYIHPLQKLILLLNRESPQLDLLLSVAILILVYFIVLQTFFSHRRAGTLENSFDAVESDDPTHEIDGNESVVGIKASPVTSDKI